MGLVEYSDSETSDTEEKASSKAAEGAAEVAAATSKAGFRKVVDKSNPHKIVVNLPGAASTDPDDNESLRPAKRAKIGGGGFNSFLPAPKKAAKHGSAPTSDSNVPAKPRAVGLGHGISLKTGATPAFSRAPLQQEGEEMDYSAAQLEPTTVASGDETFTTANETLDDTSKAPEKRTKPIFRPLSVARKPDKKKKKERPATEMQTASLPEPQAPVIEDSKPRPKRSLFANEVSAEKNVAENASDGQYKPFFRDEDPDITDAHAPANPIDTGPDANGGVQQSDSNLESLTNTLNLTAAQKRHLFGRGGVPSNTTMSQFSVSQEYSDNQALLASGQAAAPVHNPVRSIAPGKHSLQQLLNQASTQKEAMEESFAAGRRNKKEAGSRYGW